MGIYKRIAFLVMAGIIAVCSAGCDIPKSEAAQRDTCFIYTDGLLDDLCAIEYLSQRYDNAVIMLHNPEELADSPYASVTVTDENRFLCTDK